MRYADRPTRDYLKSRKRIELCYGGPGYPKGELFGNSLRTISTACEKFIFDIGQVSDSCPEVFDVINDLIEYEAPEVSFGSIIQDTDRVNAISKHILSERGGRIPKYLYEYPYLFRLSLVFVTASISTKLPAYSVDESEDNPQKRFKGALIDLVSECLCFLGDKQSNQTIGKKIKNPMVGPAKDLSLTLRH